ncbi:hypothetical protein GCM10011348_18660 [Marinobacterium nitratireducens]|uniref:Uncharacterized protein n=1 Tax=Marinobacterium nitratireducens TaxID=518897 RepID=A0A917ZCK8_9GAMM|nr:hypothetical protein [Marinobacterium nitratireducens]GGO80900.1 hypothetical protein GCM10011348_18660 [Marinobacterium nitratireducens]
MEKHEMKSDPYKTMDLSIKGLTLVGALIAAIWAYHTYTDTKEKEFYTTFWNTKLQMFLETSAAASTMATTESIEDFYKARTRYQELFFGRLSLVEGDSVKKAMIEFSSLIPGEAISQDMLPLEFLQQPAYRLTITMKEELGSAWRAPFEEI